MSGPGAKTVMGLALVIGWASAIHAGPPGDAADFGSTLGRIFSGEAVQIEPPATSGGRSSASPRTSVPGRSAARAVPGRDRPSAEVDFSGFLNKIFQPALPPQPTGTTPSDATPGAPVPRSSRELGAPQASGPSDILLSGVIIAGTTQMALLQQPGSASGPALVKLGDALGRYRLTKVESDRVTLTGPEGEVVLRLSAGSSAGGGPVRAAGDSRPADASVGSVRAERPTGGAFDKSTLKRRPDRRSLATGAPAAVQSQGLGNQEGAGVDQPRGLEKRTRETQDQRRAEKAQARTGQGSR